jgi:hypothetical protein
MSRIEGARPVGIEITYDRDFPRMRERFASLPFQYYRNEHNPLDLEEPGTNGVGGTGEIGDVIDDLADVWLDIECGLELFDRGDRDAAAWHWHLMFKSHWGRHATAALYALHCWLVDTDDAP